MLWSTRVRLGCLRWRPGEWRALICAGPFLRGSLLARRHRAAYGGAGGTGGVEERGLVCMRSRGAIESLGAVWGDPPWVILGAHWRMVVWVGSGRGEGGAGRGWCVGVEESVSAECGCLVAPGVCDGRSHGGIIGAGGYGRGWSRLL